MDNLKATFLANANAMFGGGFIWLVRIKSYRSGEDKLTNFRIMRTYSAGSPLAAAHWRAQVEDMQNVSLGDQSREIAKRIANDAVVEVEPVLCVSVWEHSYIVDWKVQGKQQFLDAWWDRINWNIVEELACVRDQPPEDIPGQRRWGHGNRWDKKGTAPFSYLGNENKSVPLRV
jgi:superoxide dismutase, Fe-Mn family